MKNKKHAFTLIELIVVIAILVILGTVAFISLSGYSVRSTGFQKTNRCKKSILKNYYRTSELVKLPEINQSHTGKINGKEQTIFQGIANFETLKEDENQFKDPITEADYPIAYTRLGMTDAGNYSNVGYPENGYPGNKLIWDSVTNDGANPQNNNLWGGVSGSLSLVQICCS